MHTDLYKKLADLNKRNWRPRRPKFQFLVTCYCMLHSPPPTSSHLGNQISLFPYTVICVMAVWERMTASAVGSWWGGGPPPARCMYVVLLPGWLDVGPRI